jgi:hypothetical protein
MIAASLTDGDGVVNILLQKGANINEKSRQYQFLGALLLC